MASFTAYTWEEKTEMKSRKIMANNQDLRRLAIHVVRQCVTDLKGKSLKESETAKEDIKKGGLSIWLDILDLDITGKAFLDDLISRMDGMAV